MTEMRKCVHCGMDLTDTSATTCPTCGTRIVPALGTKIWIVALFQLAFATGFMLLFRFPKFMIAMFDIVILIGTAVSARLKTRPIPRPVVQRPTLHPALFRVVSLLIAACAFALLAFLLLGSVMVANSLTLWQQYRGKTYHRTEFEVTRPYYQKSGKGHDIYASGVVEGQREWMSLMPYLHTMPHSQAELDERVPPGTVIPIYHFPQMKGRMRVRVNEGIPPADAYYQEAIKESKVSLLGLALIGLAVLMLWRIRALCFARATTSFQEAAAGQGPVS
jgi:hypothetical protein